LLESRERTVMLFPDLRVTFKQHVDIYEAIKERDIEKAGRKMFEHLSVVENVLKKAENQGK
jgi:DNA-binding GntR family transcriptional regulator